MAHHGVILSQNGATASRNLFKSLSGLFDAICVPKISKIRSGQKCGNNNL